MGNTVHDVFHTSLLLPYHKTVQHGPNFSRPPPDLIGGEAEYGVEAIRNHWHFRCSHALQYLIKWQGYPKSDNMWEPANNDHVPNLLKAYGQKHIKASVLGALKTIPSHPGSSQPSRLNLLSALHHPQVSQFCP
jgi:hypothetical protein